MLVAPIHQLEEGHAAVGRDRQVADLVDNHQAREDERPDARQQAAGRKCLQHQGIAFMTLERSASESSNGDLLGGSVSVGRTSLSCQSRRTGAHQRLRSQILVSETHLSLEQMEIPGLLQSQVADIGRVVVQQGFSLGDFDTDEEYDFAAYSPLPVLRHKPTGSWFGFGRSMRARGYSGHFEDEGFLIVRTPGFERPSESKAPLRWSDVPTLLSEWLRFIRRELEAADVWHELQRTGSAASFEASLDSEPFTGREREAISDRLTAIEESLAAAARGKAEMDSYIRSEFEELKAELARMNRGRWKKMFLGTIASMAMRHVVPEEAVRSALHVARDFLIDQGARLLSP